MPFKEKLFYTILILIPIAGFIYLSRSIAMPFICSIAISYLLNPVVTKFHESQDTTRLRATILIMCLFSAVFISVSLVLLPTIYAQSVALIDAIPHYFRTFTHHLYPQIATLLNNLGLEVDKNFSHMATQQGVTSNVLHYSKNFLHDAFNSSAFAINFLSLVFLTPFLVFYILKDWNIIMKKLNGYLPKESYTVIRSILREIDETLTSYIRGQINVCLILGTIYSILLSCTGLNFGFAIGFLTGLLSFIPYAGMFIGVVLGITVSIFQWGFDISQLSLITLIFFVGQIIESNMLTPKLVGSRIGLHPAWMIFGLFFFGDLLGFLGVLAAVPLTAIFSVIIKHLALEYKIRFAHAQ
jgi:predicted PurR-regulated permease PerM